MHASVCAFMRPPSPTEMPRGLLVLFPWCFCWLTPVCRGAAPPRCRLQPCWPLWHNPVQRFPLVPRTRSLTESLSILRDASVWEERRLPSVHLQTVGPKAQTASPQRLTWPTLWDGRISPEKGFSSKTFQQFNHWNHSEFTQWVQKRLWPMRNL